MAKISPDITKKDFLKLLTTRELLDKRIQLKGFNFDDRPRRVL